MSPVTSRRRQLFNIAAVIVFAGLTLVGFVALLFTVGDPGPGDTAESIKSQNTVAVVIAGVAWTLVIVGAVVWAKWLRRRLRPGSDR
jgi:hypothetical protein